MDVTVYLPDEIGRRAKDEELKLSRMLRDAVTAEFKRRDAIDEALDEIQTYEVWPVEMNGVLVTGRITGKLIASCADSQDGVLFLTDDKRVLGHVESDASIERLDDPTEQLVANLNRFFDGEFEPFTEACQALGVAPVIDL
jgi:hypothetical protein